MNSKPLLLSGIGLCGVGVITLVVVAAVDLGRADQIASVTGAAVGLVGVALALLGQFGGARSGVDASGDGAVAAGGSIGFASTGGGTPAAGPVPQPAPRPGTPPPGQVNASGRGSVAAGGDIGSASTGSGPTP
ncbi:hypothetical protein GCM10010254_01800 [Streptomyces chromofuscus]|uniref:Uncharacterized protein n=1 Tax=Streptomyces chromofuscus TaxID=42881 RepID=A0A7M2T316_STRCW|nr:hypothetical protein [Streptomyces chromofuscus]QOV42088.1 hypothetical protein IPT68_19680 [Streptomyces chromofuscus]GGS85706.1 hypothetical protein GCM10010254_01800 [Streptomyces chromofuscus]